jgi:hypothetical protein
MALCFIHVVPFSWFLVGMGWIFPRFHFAFGSVAELGVKERLIDRLS